MPQPPKNNNNQGNSDKKSKLPTLHIPDEDSGPVKEVKPNQQGQFILKHQIGVPGAPIPNSADSAEEGEERARRQNDPNKQLSDRTTDCTSGGWQASARRAPTLTELETAYANADKETIVGVLVRTSRWICAGADLSLQKRRDIITAEELKKKWHKLDTRDDARGEAVDDHKDKLGERSIDDLGKMLADAFGDIDQRMGFGSGSKEGMPIVKRGAGTPEPAKDWY